MSLQMRPCRGLTLSGVEVLNPEADFLTTET